MLLMIHTSPYTTNTTQTSMPPAGFFFCLSGVFSTLIHFCTFKSFRPSCHFTFHATVLTTNTTQTSMPPLGFEPTIPVSERPQTHALESAATGIGMGSNLGLRGGWPETIRLIHGTAWCRIFFQCFSFCCRYHSTNVLYSFNDLCVGL
jgi:hypothetical protein